MGREKKTLLMTLSEQAVVSRVSHRHTSWCLKATLISICPCYVTEWETKARILAKQGEKPGVRHPCLRLLLGLQLQGADRITRGHLRLWV